MVTMIAVEKSPDSLFLKLRIFNIHNILASTSFLKIFIMKCTACQKTWCSVWKISEHLHSLLYLYSLWKKVKECYWECNCSSIDQPRTYNLFVFDPRSNYYEGQSIYVIKYCLMVGL